MGGEQLAVGVVPSASTAVAPSSGAVPTMVVGRSWSSATPPFGLGEPMALLGGGRLGSDGVAGRLGRERHGWLVDHVEAACRDQLASDRRWFRMPPVILCAPAFGDALHAARRLAWEAGVPHLTLDLADGGRAALGGGGRGPDPATPSWLAAALASLRCANPAVTVTGLEALDAGRREVLLAMLDPARGCRLEDEALGTSLDLSEVTWMLVSEPGADPAHWLEAVAVPVPLFGPTDLAAVELAWIEALTEVAADRGLHGAADDLVWSAPPEIAGRGRDGRPSGPDLAEAARAAFDATYGRIG